LRTVMHRKDGRRFHRQGWLCGRTQTHRTVTGRSDTDTHRTPTPKVGKGFRGKKERKEGCKG
jgi:hypothetical protein